MGEQKMLAIKKTVFSVGILALSMSQKKLEKLSMIGNS